MNYYCLDCSKEFFLEDADEMIVCPFCNSEDVEELDDEEFDDEEFDDVDLDEDIDDDL